MVDKGGVVVSDTVDAMLAKEAVRFAFFGVYSLFPLTITLSLK
ncbi:hypothetical protein [Enterobacter hormaechei]